MSSGRDPSVLPTRIARRTVLVRAVVAMGSSILLVACSNDADAPAAKDLVWTPEVEARLARIPSFIRSRVRTTVERHARNAGLETVTSDVMTAALEEAGPDLPFQRPEGVSGSARESRE